MGEVFLTFYILPSIFQIKFQSLLSLLLINIFHALLEMGKITFHVEVIFNILGMGPSSSIYDNDIYIFSLLCNNLHPIL